MSSDPERDAQFAHYRALKLCKRYLPISALEDGCLYLIHARNSHIGRWVEKDRAFTLLREKSGERYLSNEFHWDTGEPHGTAKPYAKFTEVVSSEGIFDLLDRQLIEIPYTVFMERTREFIQ